MILWGPPGTGKTTLARLVAQTCDAEFIAFSAVMAGVKDIRAAAERASEVRKESGRRTVLFLDEVHRFNKAQQDAFLPWVEDGTLVFIGATTENPSFELNNALLSRARVYVLRALTEQDLRKVLERALERQARSGTPIEAEEQALDADRPRRGRRCTARAEHAGVGVRSRRRLPSRRGLRRPSRQRSQPAVCAASTSRARRSTTRFPRFTSRCGGATRTQRSIGSAECSTAVATHATSRAACCAWPRKTSATQTRALSPWRWKRAKCTSASARRKVNWRSRRPSCSSPAPPRATRCMPRSAKPWRMRRSSARWKCRCICAMLRRG